MSEILSRETIRLGLTATDKTDAITQCGSLLVAVGAVTQPYADAMFEREHQVPTYLGEGVAIPHGTNESREHIQRTCLGFLQFPGGVTGTANGCSSASRSRAAVRNTSRSSANSPRC